MKLAERFSSRSIWSASAEPALYTRPCRGPSGAPNPEGILAPKSPGLRVLRATLGPRFTATPTLERVVALPITVRTAPPQLRHNPVGVAGTGRPFPRVARKRATLGFEAQSLRDCALRVKSGQSEASTPLLANLSHPLSASPFKSAVDASFCRRTLN